MSVKDIQKIAREFIEHKVTANEFVISVVEQLVADRKNHADMIRIAQALFFMAPEPGDGS